MGSLRFELLFATFVPHTKMLIIRKNRALAFDRLTESGFRVNRTCQSDMTSAAETEDISQFVELLRFSLQDFIEFAIVPLRFSRLRFVIRRNIRDRKLKFSIQQRQFDPKRSALIHNGFTLQSAVMLFGNNLISDR